MSFSQIYLQANRLGKLSLLTISKSISLSQPSFRLLSTTPVSRKKKSSNNNEGLFNFDIEAKKMLLKIETGISPLENMNENFAIIKPAEEELIIQVKRGKFIFKLDHTNQFIVLQSYISGHHKYFYDLEDKQWLCVKDGHDLRGLITRDFMKHSNGLPLID
jgi:frataxin-like iron-binding protein CyaY